MNGIIVRFWLQLLLRREQAVTLLVSFSVVILFNLIMNEGIAITYSVNLLFVAFFLCRLRVYIIVIIQSRIYIFLSFLITV